LPPAVMPTIHGVHSLISVSPPSAFTRTVLWRCTRTGGSVREFRSLNSEKMVSSWLRRGRGHHLRVSQSAFPVLFRNSSLSCSEWGPMDIVVSPLQYICASFMPKKFVPSIFAVRVGCSCGHRDSFTAHIHHAGNGVLWTP
jgi:hypothetical protein